MKPSMRQPKFMIIYHCPACGHDSGYTELDKPKCRFCDANERLSVVSRKKLTPKVMKERLKTTTDNMMKALEKAYELLPTVDKNVLGEGKDPEAELLKLMANAKALRDKVQGLELRKPE